MPLDLPRIRAICFDVDGTLSNTDDQFVLKLVNLLSPVQSLFPNFDSQAFSRKVVMATETPGNYFFGLPDRLQIDDEIASIGDFIYRMGLGKEQHPFLLIDGAKTMLEKLYPHYPLAVVSARGERSTGWFLDQFNLWPLFKTVVTAQTCAYTKPYPDPIEWAAKEMGVLPYECLMVGDTTVDILAAKAAGAQSIGVLCGFGERDELKAAGADMIVKTTQDITSTLLGHSRI
ncbi:MAG: HAD family hydrolase [Chloroflexota bacterium]